MSIVVVACLPLGGGCSSDDNPDGVQIYAADATGVAQCKSEHPDKAADCEKALSGAQAEQASTVPHYTLSECMDQYGASACQPRDSGSYFVPALAGFTFGYIAGSLEPPIYHPVYVNLNGQAYYGHTFLGTYHPGTRVYVVPPRGASWVSTYHVRTVSLPPASRPAQSPPSYNYGASHIERGGIGGSASILRKQVPDDTSAARPASSSISRGGIGASSMGRMSSG